MSLVIQKLNNNYVITSTGSNLVVEVYKIDNCLDNSSRLLSIYQSTSIISTDGNKRIVTIPPIEDGKYNFRIKEYTPQETIKETYVYSYYNLLQSIIKDIEKVLCNCNCDDCEDCYESEELYSKTLLKVMTYNTLTSKFYASIIDKVFSCLECSLIDINNCILLNENLHGSADNKRLFKKILSGYYLAFYYSELKNNEDKDFVNKMFNYTFVSKCLENNGINLNCIKEKINSMATFTINSALYINKAPSTVGNYTLGVNNRVTTVLSTAMFTSSTTPPYADPENDAPKEVRIDSLPTLGTLKLNGVDVTVGQIIPISEITANKLTYVSPNQDLAASVAFNFSVSDAGSGLFTS